MKRVAVTGLGVISPVGNDVPTFWNALCSGTCGIGPITKFDATDYPVKLAAEVRDFDPKQYMEKLDILHSDVYTHFAMAAACQAVADSGIAGTLDAERVGVYIGSGIGGIATFMTEHSKLLNRGPRRVSPYFIPMMLPNMASRMLAGGAEATVNALAAAGFSNMQALSPSEDPNAASLPFDVRRAGFVMGEGAGVLVLEELEHAKQRGATIYAELTGYGSTCDAYHITSPDPSAAESARAIADAWRETSLDSDRVYFNAHGTGTPMNDRIETLAIKKALGEDRAHRITISSTKSMTGHMLGAAGGAEAVASVLALRDGIAPPTINLTQQDPDCDLDYTPLTAKHADFDVALSSSLGFGGHNACLAFRKWED